MAAKINHSHVYVQHRDTRRFLTADACWTKNATEAEDFKTAVNALAYCLNRNLADAQVLIQSITRGKPDFVFPITAPLSSG